ncbi:MAG TPA: hypothetical protein VLC71_12930 [Thermomonas sp.]|nr:hypothetical protein [Thermomonas sp.]
MREWGSGPLKNDAAQDLILALEPLSADGRVLAVRQVFAEHGDLHRRLREAAPVMPLADGDAPIEASLRAIAAGWLVAAALGRVVRPARQAMLAGTPADVLAELANIARDTLAAILADDAEIAARRRHAWSWNDEIRRLHAALAPDAPLLPAGTGEYEDLDDPETLARHNWQYRMKMLLLMAAIIAAVYLFR